MGRWASSLLARIVLAEVLIITLACVALPLLAGMILHTSVARIENAVLTQQTETVVRAARARAGGGWQVDLPEVLRPIYATGYDGRAYAVVDGRGTVLASSRFAQPGLWPRRAFGRAPARFEAGSLVGMVTPVTIAGVPAWVVVSQDQDRPGAIIDDVTRVFLSRYLILLVAGLLLIPPLHAALLWRSLKKLRDVAGQAAAIDPRGLHVRLSLTGLPAEAEALVRATNDLLGRVEEACARQEEFASNVAHELRTPLAALRVQVAGVADAATRAAMVAQIERMSHVLTQLRDLAALEGASGAAMAPVDLAGLAVDLVAEMTPAILARGRVVAVVGAERPIRVRGNAPLLWMALRNLIDNALDHTPGGTRVEVALLADGGLSVADDGPGITEQDASLLPRRFWRADQARSDGAGLGLSIVQRIVAVHRGALEIGRSPLGGALFTLRFQPVAAPDKAS